MPKAGRIEFCGEIPKRPYKIAVFDFDGTVSWLRHGWPGLMCKIFSAYYQPPGGPAQLMDEILSLNGKPTIHQMRAIHEQAKAAGVVVPAPEELLGEYHNALYGVIQTRWKMLENGEAKVDDFLVSGVRTFLEALVSRGVKLFVLSGTVQPQVRAEAEMLGVTKYFEGGVFGNSEDPTRFTKMAMFKRFISEEGINPSELLAFGDGAIEIENVRNLGGTAIGVASNEEQNGGAERDERKAKQLREAGGLAIIPDYECVDELLKELFP